MYNFTEQEWLVLGIIVHTGGDDYDVWPWFDRREDMVTLNALQDRGIVNIEPDGDIVILNGEIADEALWRWNHGGDSDGLHPCAKCGNDTTNRLCRSCAEQEAIDQS